MERYITFTPILILNVGTGNVTAVRFSPAHADVPDRVEIHTIDSQRFSLSGEEATAAWKMFYYTSNSTMNFKEK